MRKHVGKEERKQLGKQVGKQDRKKAYLLNQI